MKTLKFALSIILIQFLISSIHINAQPKETDPIYLKSNYGKWLTEESKHFIINYRDSSFRANKIEKKNIEQILKTQEQNLVEISKKTGIDTSSFNSLKKINIWLFVDYEEQMQITKIQAPAFGIIHPYWSLYFYYEIAGNKHELAHLISTEYWGRFGSNKYQMLIEEGFANYIDEWGIKNGNFAKSAKKNIRIKKDFLQRIIENPNGSNGIFVNPYKQNIVVSSAFVKFLIDTYGIEKFKILWKELKDDEVTFYNIYGKSFGELKVEFYQWIKRTR